MESGWYLVKTPFTTRELADTYKNNPLVQAPNRFAIGLSYPLLYTVLTLPHWLMALLSASLASVPWISQRFSLRTLLIATTLIAVVLGLVVWSMS